MAAARSAVGCFRCAEAEGGVLVHASDAVMEESGGADPRWGRERLSSSYKRAFEEISAILFRYDPMGINFGGNTTEYDAEAGSILARFRSDMSVDEATAVVHEEFERWFGHAGAGPESGYAEIAAEILDAFRRADLR